jgi:hypothetical protein
MGEWQVRIGLPHRFGHARNFKILRKIRRVGWQAGSTPYKPEKRRLLGVTEFSQHVPEKANMGI